MALAYEGHSAAPMGITRHVSEHVAEVGGEPAALPRQLHVDLIVLSVGSQPVGDRFAREQRTHGGTDLLH